MLHCMIHWCNVALQKGIGVRYRHRVEKERQHEYLVAYKVITVAIDTW
jgi:hypothetical protein